MLAFVSAAGAAPEHAPRPPIHFDQTSVLTLSGKVQMEDNYHTLVANCHKAGLATKELSKDDVALVSRVHVETWVSPEKTARREESWELMVSEHPLCQFSLIHKDQTEIASAGGHSVLIDNVSHDIDVQEVGAEMQVGPMPAGDGDMDDAARKTGWSKIGLASANGAQCAVWRDAQGGELCIWTGGGPWGYTAYGVDALKDGMSSGMVIILWAHPGTGPSWRLETKTFTVGLPLGDAPFRVPANATVKK